MLPTILEDRGAGGGSHLREHTWIVQQGIEPFREKAGTTLDKITCFTVANHCHQPPCASGYYWRATCQGFDSGQTEALMIGGNYSDIGSAIDHGQFLLWPGTQKMHALAYLEFPGQLT